MTKELITHGNLIIAESREFVCMPNNLNEKELHLLLLLSLYYHIQNNSMLYLISKVLFQILFAFSY